MKTLLLFTACALPAVAQELTTSALDSGGSLTSGGDVEIAGSLGGFGDVSGDGATTARAGFPGQLYDPARVAITPGDATLTDNSVTPFSAKVVCDDDTLLPAPSVAWSVDSPLLSISPAGEVRAGPLPQDLFAALTASASGVTGTATLIALDATPDDFGSYAGDGLPDDWQIYHFGFDNADPAPGADPDSDGQDNQTEFLAGTGPRDGGSFLQMRTEPVDGEAGERRLHFSPWRPDRNYTWEFSLNFQSPWNPVPGATVTPAPNAGGEATDRDAVESRKFYRLRIE